MKIILQNFSNVHKPIMNVTLINKLKASIFHLKLNLRKKIFIDTYAGRTLERVEVALDGSVQIQARN